MSFWYGHNLTEQGIVVKKVADGWPFVPWSKRRPDKDIEAIVYQIVQLRTIKNYTEADALRRELVADGALVTYERDGTVRVAY